MSLSKCVPEAMEEEIAEQKAIIAQYCTLIDRYENQRDKLSARIKVKEELINTLQRELDDA